MIGYGHSVYAVQLADGEMESCVITFKVHAPLVCVRG